MFVPALILDAPYVQRAIAELALLAVLAGVLGSWIVLRRLAFYTHAVGTATFPGLVVAAPWGVAPQLTALAAALGFGAGIERLSRGRCPGRSRSPARSGASRRGRLAPRRPRRP